MTGQRIHALRMAQLDHIAQAQEHLRKADAIRADLALLEGPHSANPIPAATHTGKSGEGLLERISGRGGDNG